MLHDRPESRRGIGRRLAAVAALVALGVGSPAPGQGLEPDVGLPGARGGRLDRFGDPLPAGAIARLGTVRLQHRNAWSVQFSLDGKLLASAGKVDPDRLADVGTARLWDVATGREDHRLGALSGRIVFFPDGKTVITAGEEQMDVRELATGKTLYWLPVRSENFAISADGQTLAAAVDDGYERWDLVARTALGAVKLGGHILAFAPDARQAVVRNQDDLFIIDLVTGRCALLLKDTEDGTCAIAYAPDGKSLAVCSSAGRITVWDTATRKLRFQLCERDNTANAVIRFSPDGQKLVTAGPAASVHIWEVGPRGRVCNCDAVPDWFLCAAFSPDGKTLAVAGLYGRLQLLDVASGKFHMPFEQPPDVSANVWFSGDGKAVLTTTSGDSIRGGMAAVWDAAAGKVLKELPCFADDGHMEVTAGGSALAVRNQSGDFALLATATGARRKLPGRPGGPAYAISGDGKRLATTGLEPRDVTLWDVATGKEVRRFPKLAGATRLALSPDGSTLIAACLKVFAPPLRPRITEGSELADDTIHAFDVTTGRQLWKVADARSQDFAFSSDGRWLATAGQLPVPEDDTQLSTEVRLLDAATGRQAWMADKHQQPVRAFAFSPDGRTLATGCEAGEVRLWETASGEERLAFRAHPAGITGLSFSPDGDRLVTAGEERTALVWDLVELPAGRGDPAAAWAALAADDGRQAYAAVRQLAADPARAVPLLRARLRPAAAADPGRVTKLIADLDGDAFAAREAAQRELVQLGDSARPAVRRALAAGGSAEGQRRLRQVLEQVDGYTADQLREWRALEVLERIGTPDARQVLTVVADGLPGARLTAEAKAARQRLAARATKP